VTVTSQHNDLPLCQGTNETPSGRFPSDRNNPAGSLVTETPTEAKLRATKSLIAWCLADLPGALLHTKLWRPRASTGEPQWQLCGTQRTNPSLRPTATLTASSSNLSPHDAIGKANNQSPLCCEKAARNDLGDVPCADWLLLMPCPPARQGGLRTVAYQVRRSAHYQTWLTNRTDSSEESHYQNSDIRPRCQLGGTVCSLLKPRRQGVQAKTHVLLLFKLWRQISLEWTKIFQIG